MVRAWLLDLDGTLLDLDGDAFLEAYLQEVAQWMAPIVDPARFTEALWSAAIPVMVNRTGHPGRSNSDMLWAALADALQTPAATLWQRFEEFVQGDLTRIYPGGSPMPGAHDLVAVGRARGMKLAVATMPIYPRPVIDERLRRAGLLDVPWDLVATDAMESVKPQPAYYQEIADRLQVAPTECLMVGDDYFRDMAARKVGMATAYVGPPLVGVDTGPSGTLTDWVRVLGGDGRGPTCAEGAMNSGLSGG